jgi:hypothetical protein
VNKEQLTGTIARISCTVTGLTEELGLTKWTTSEDVDVTSLEGYTVVPGSLEVDTQTTTLTVPADKNNNDATYWCVITSTEHGVTEQKTEVSSKVFSKYCNLKLYVYPKGNVLLILIQFVKLWLHE